MCTMYRHKSKYFLKHTHDLIKSITKRKQRKDLNHHSIRNVKIKERVGVMLIKLFYTKRLDLCHRESRTAINMLFLL